MRGSARAGAACDVPVALFLLTATAVQRGASAAGVRGVRAHLGSNHSNASWMRSGNGSNVAGTREDDALHCLEVRPSSIPGAGDGLFATCDWQAGACIGEYFGAVSSEAPADGKYAWKVPVCRDASAVVHQKNKQELERCAPTRWQFVDGWREPLPAEKRNPIRFVNSIRSADQRASLNVAVRFERGRVFYDATRHVRSGQELIVDYGPTYWKAREKLAKVFNILR